MDVQTSRTDMITGAHYTYIDPEYINEMADGDNGFIIQFVGVCLESIPNHLAKLTAVADGDDYAQITFYTHKLRGSLNFIGGAQLIGLLDQIDALCNAQTALPVIRQIVKEAKVIADLIIAELHQLMNSAATEN